MCGVSFSRGKKEIANKQYEGYNKSDAFASTVFKFLQMQKIRVIWKGLKTHRNVVLFFFFSILIYILKVLKKCTPYWINVQNSFLFPWCNFGIEKALGLLRKILNSHLC